MAEVVQFLTKEFPELDPLVYDYFKSMLEEITPDFESIHEAFGEFLYGAFPKRPRSEIESVCHKIYDLIGECGGLKDNTPVKLDAPVKFSELSKERSMFGANTKQDNSIRALNVDKRRLAKAELKRQQKLEKKGKLSSQIQLDNFSTSQAVVKTENINSYDIHVADFDVTFGSRILLKNASVNLASGKRYGIVGRNGYGKTTLLRAISNRDLAIPAHLSVLHVEQEVNGDDTNIVDCVLQAHTKWKALLDEESRLNEEIKELESNGKDANDIHGRIAKIYEEFEEIGASEFPSIVTSILAGLGFNSEMQKLPTKLFSGGWRMRLALAQALFMKPDLLLLDEPTNMLDLRAIMWLRQYLESWKRTIVIVSHDKVFLDSIATDIIHVNNQSLQQYRGNYSTFYKTKSEKHLHQQREYESQVAYREHLQTFVDRFRANANRASQAQSKLKIIEKLPDLKPIDEEPPVVLKFADCEKFSGCLVRLDAVSYSYKSGHQVLNNVDLSASYGSRITIIGENGSGKSTLLKIVAGMFEPEGLRHVGRNARIGYFSQHHVDQLVLTQSSLGMLHSKFPDKTENECRSHLGSFGLPGDLATRPLVTLSGGQKSRAALAILAMAKPNLLVLDEPTNHLDIETIEALVKALKTFQGGVILVSHNEYLIREVTNELWLCKNGSVGIYKSGLDGYLAMLNKFYKSY